MPFSFADLGPLSETAASYLGAMPVDANDVLAAELHRRQAENDVVVASLAIKRARANRCPLTALERELVKKAEAHVCSGVQPPARFAHIPRVGRRAHATMLSLADPGSGHLALNFLMRLRLHAIRAAVAAEFAHSRNLR